MKVYLDIQVKSLNGKVLFDRSLPDVDLHDFPFGEIVHSFNHLFKNCVVLVSSSLPKNI